MKPSPLSETREVYFVPVKAADGSLREKASRFLAFLYPAFSVSEADSLRKALSKKYHDAAHQPYAVRLGSGAGLLEKWSDDGEPTHTAGEPILKALREARMTNSLMVVVRYFGGTKLGTGGLMKAFQEAARIAIADSELKECVPSDPMEAWVPFSLEGQFRHILSRHGGVPSGEVREEEYHAVVEIPVENRAAFEKALTEMREKWKSTLRWKWK